MTSTEKLEEITPEEVQSFLQSNPNFLEAYVTGPHISRNTFQHWTLKRNNRLRKDSRRQLLPLYTVNVLNFVTFTIILDFCRTSSI